MLIYIVLLLLLLLPTTLYFCIPYLFLYWKTFKNRFLFSGLINYPSKADKFIGEPAKFGLQNTCNHVIPLGKRGNIGVWEVGTECEAKEKIVILYCHGASSNRGKPHRVDFYKTYQNLGYTIIAFDYRGFGDSKGSRATEVSVISDCRIVFEWAALRYPEHRFVVWGHSLGSGISTKFVTQLQTDSDPCLDKNLGLILESAFISAHEAAKHMPAARYWNYFKITRGKIARSMENIFPTVELLPDIKVPVLLIHAMDDITIPHRHSEVLHETCRRRSSGEVEMYSAEKGQHKWVHRDEGAVRCAAQFITRVATQ